MKLFSLVVMTVLFVGCDGNVLAPTTSIYKPTTQITPPVSTPIKPPTVTPPVSTPVTVVTPPVSVPVVTTPTTPVVSAPVSAPVVTVTPPASTPVTVVTPPVSPTPTVSQTPVVSAPVVVPVTKADLIPFYNSFMDVAVRTGYPLQHPTSLSMDFVDAYEAGSAKIGQCSVIRYPDGTVVSSVTFLKSFYESANETTRKSLIYHELAHCILYRSHTTETMDVSGYQMPKSLMFPNMINNTYNSVFGPNFMKNNFTYFETELFNPSYVFVPVSGASPNSNSKSSKVQVFETNENNNCEDHQHSEPIFENL